MEPDVEIAILKVELANEIRTLKIQLANAEARAVMWENLAMSYGCRIEQQENVINDLLTEVKQLEETDGT